MSGSEMAFRRIMSNLEILHGSMQYFCMECLYMGRGVSGIFGGIFPALETCFSLVGGEKGFRGSTIRARVLERKPRHQNYRGCWSGLWITGKILREQFPSQIILKRFVETIRKREKVFQVSENTAKIRFEFSGCYRAECGRLGAANSVGMVQSGHHLRPGRSS